MRATPVARERPSFAGGAESDGGDCREAAVDHLENPIAVLEHVTVVGDHHDGHAVGVRTVGQKLDDLMTACPVERRGRFVDEQDARVVDHRAGDADALALSTGELTGAVTGAVRHPDRIEQRRGVDLAVARDPTRQAQLVGGGERREQVTVGMIVTVCQEIAGSPDRAG